MSNSGRQAGADGEIEVTGEMVEAGADALRIEGVTLDYMDERKVLTAAFRAMIEAKTSSDQRTSTDF